MKLDFGSLKFKNEGEYYTALGTFCNRSAFVITFETNSETGSYGDAYRLCAHSSVKTLIAPIQDAMRSHNRINCNDYVLTLLKNHNFVQNGKKIYGNLENVIKTVPKDYIPNFFEGYNNSSLPNTNMFVSIEIEGIETVKEIKKVGVPKKPTIKRTINNTSLGEKTKIKRDYAKESIKNAVIGELGERHVFEIERKKLLTAMQNNTLSCIDGLLKWVSLEDDSAGYDILSYDVENKKPMYIEVKTTSAGKLTPFYMSKGEIEFSNTHANHYHLYRIYNIFSGVAEYFELTGDISASEIVQIDEMNYLISVK